MKTKENIHAGHRERLRKYVEKTGIYNLSDLHMLEYLLTFSIPRADTNPIAHALLKEFKTIDNIFGASQKALCSVDGIGPNTARFLELMSGVCYFNNRAKAQNNPYAGNLNGCISFIQNILPPSENEQFIVLILSKNLKVKNYKIFKGISHSYINFDLKELSEFLINHRASFCIMAHTHPNHNATPSNSDIATFNTIQPLIDSLSIVLLDNLILGETEFCSFRNDFIRFYDELNTVVLNRSYPLSTFRLEEKNGQKFLKVMTRRN